MPVKNSRTAVPLSRSCEKAIPNNVHATINPENKRNENVKTKNKHVIKEEIRLFIDILNNNNISQQSNNISEKYNKQDE